MQKCSLKIETMLIYKHPSQDFFQAAETLLEKRCFFGPVIVLSFIGFESCCKRLIRLLLQEKNGYSAEKADEYLEREVVGKWKIGSLPTVIVKEFEKLAGLGNEIKALPSWKIIEEKVVKWRRSLVHTGNIKGHGPTLEQAEISLKATQEVANFLDNKILKKMKNNQK